MFHHSHIGKNIVPTIFQNWFKLNYNTHSYNTSYNIDNAINSDTLFIINDRTTHYGNYYYYYLVLKCGILYITN